MPNYPVVAQAGRGRPKKSTSFTKASSMMRKIAKQVVNKEAETKSFLSTGNTQTCTDDVLYAFNLISGIPQGDDHDDRIGNKIHIKNIYAKLQLLSVNNASATNASKHFRVMIIKTKTPLVNTFSSITATNVFRVGTISISALRGFPDRNKVTVLYDKLISNTTDISNENDSKALTINLKINKTEYFEDDASLYLKNGNYYLITSCTSGVSTGFGAGVINFNYAVNFKDI